MTTYEVSTYNSNGSCTDHVVEANSLTHAKQVVAKRVRYGLGSECANSTVICTAFGEVLSKCNHGLTSSDNEWTDA